MGELPVTPLDQAQAYWPLYMEAKYRYGRSGGCDSRLKLEFEALQARMDKILELMFVGMEILEVPEFENVQDIVPPKPLQQNFGLAGGEL